MAHSTTNVGPHEEIEEEEVTPRVSFSDDDDEPVGGVEKTEKPKVITTEDDSVFDTSDDREGK